MIRAWSTLDLDRLTAHLNRLGNTSVVRRLGALAEVGRACGSPWSHEAPAPPALAGPTHLSRPEPPGGRRDQSALGGPDERAGR